MIKYILIFLSAIISSFLCLFPITDTDIFWHLSAGREIITNKHFLYCDPFSFSLNLPNWIDLHWLFQVSIYGFYNLFGLKGLLYFKLICIILNVIILCLIYQKNHIYIFSAALSCILLFFFARYLICERPVLITIICISLYLFLFEIFFQRKNYKILFWCIPLQIIWTNSQGLYPLGLFIIFSYLLESIINYYFISNKTFSNLLYLKKQTKFLSIIFILCFLSCFITPYGINGVLFPIRLLSRILPFSNNLYSFFVSENIPIFALRGFDLTYSFEIILIFVLLIIFFVVNKNFLKISHLILFFGFLFLAIIAVRNVLLFFIVSIFIISYNTMCYFEKYKVKYHNKFFSKLLYIIPPIIIFLLILYQIKLISIYPKNKILSPFRFPEKIVEYLKVNPVSGNIYNDIRSGGYLIWNFYPKKQVFIDGRLIIRPPKLFAEYLSVCYNPELFSFLEKKYNITHVVLPSSIFTHYRPLIKWLYNASNWHLEYTDGSFFLFVKNNLNNNILDLKDSLTIKNISNNIINEFKSSPYIKNEALQYFADITEYLGLIENAKIIKKKMLEK